jgi:hypothetical protein
VAHRPLAGEELQLKIAVSMLPLFGLLVSQPAFAKAAHAPHARAAPAKGTNADPAKPAEPVEADVTVLAPRGGFTAVNRKANASLKIAKPENFSRLPNTTVPIKPVVRNAIGQVVPSKSAIIGAPRFAPSVQVPGAAPKTITRSIVPPPLVSPSNVGRTPLRPTTTVGVSSTGRIDGSRLIRPSAAPSGIGGPAHTAGGINGTTVRTTR